MLLELVSIAQQRKSRGEAYVTWTSLKVKQNTTAPELINLEEKKRQKQEKQKVVIILFYFLKSKVSSFWIIIGLSSLYKKSECAQQLFDMERLFCHFMFVLY